MTGAGFPRGEDAIAERAQWPAVYVIAADNGEVKVGYSMCPMSRLTAIRKEYASKRGFKSVRMAGYVEVPNAIALEAYAHHVLMKRGKWLGGEWFDIDPDAALDFLIDAWNDEAKLAGWPLCRYWRFSESYSPVKINRSNA